MQPWGKVDRTQPSVSHHLAHHMADVAACFEALIALPVLRSRLEKACGVALSPVLIARLSVLAFLHDVGKLHPGFQAKGWPEGIWTDVRHGHLSEGEAIFAKDAPSEIADNLHFEALCAWQLDRGVLYSILSHHGRPLERSTPVKQRWDAVAAANYDPVLASAEIGRLMPDWFALAFSDEVQPLPKSPDFQHLFCGLVSLADWIGSTRRIFEFVPGLDPGYMDKARVKAQTAIKDVGLDVAHWREAVAGNTDFGSLTGFNAPRPQQKLVGDFPLDEQLVILEAETGSGKTEAALWRFVRLFEAGLVDSLYFAVPTRSATVQLHGRVSQAINRVFGEAGPEAVLVVPGYLRAGEIDGVKLPGWEVRWDDDNGADERKLLSRWAAENTKKSLAATIAVGTVDQAMLAGLMVKHAHLRAAALSRSFIVIDEVHASDRYMTEVQQHLLKTHLARGGHAMLMSATLGSVARVGWLGQRRAPSFEDAIAAPYPAVWGQAPEPRGATEPSQSKTVSMEALQSMAAETAGHRAIAAAKKGARVLVVRNTVAEAIATYELVVALAPELLLQVAGKPALHHGRFAPEDRALLDAAVESALSPGARAGSDGVIVIGTQTLEQSLDIDADILVTDLCPVDVLLQRIGRLHRHKMDRPLGFEGARCAVMVPEEGLEALLAPRFINGLGAWSENGVLTGIYRDVSGLELTRRLIVEHPEWRIPEMNRFLVESATHPDKIDAMNAELGPAWDNYRNKVHGKDVSEAGAARNVALRVDEPFNGRTFPDFEDSIRTRLGADGAVIALPHPVVGPFGVEISGFTLPAHWRIDVGGGEVGVEVFDSGMRVLCGGAAFRYTESGLVQEAWL